MRKTIFAIVALCASAMFAAQYTNTYTSGGATYVQRGSLKLSDYVITNFAGAVTSNDVVREVQHGLSEFSITGTVDNASHASNADNAEMASEASYASLSGYADFADSLRVYGSDTTITGDQVYETLTNLSGKIDRTLQGTPLTNSFGFPNYMTPKGVAFTESGVKFVASDENMRADYYQTLTPESLDIPFYQTWLLPNFGDSGTVILAHREWVRDAIADATNEVPAIVTNEFVIGYTEWVVSPNEYNGSKISIVKDGDGWIPWVNYGTETEAQLADRMGDDSSSSIVWTQTAIDEPITAVRQSITRNALGLARLSDIPVITNKPLGQLVLQAPNGSNFVLKVSNEGAIEIYVQ